MIETLQQLDTQAFLALNSLRWDVLDGFVAGFSGRWIWAAMYMVIAWMMLRRYGWRNGLIFIAVTAMAVGCADYVCASVVRPLVQRLRPANPDNPISAMVHIVDGYRGGSYGFPSCHAANTFCLAVITSLLIRRRAYTAFIFTWAVFQCWSRIYLGVHYPGDLLVGALVGSAIALAAYYLSVSALSATLSKFSPRHLTPSSPQDPAPHSLPQPVAEVPMWPLLTVTAVIIAVLILL